MSKRSTLFFFLCLFITLNLPAQRGQILAPTITKTLPRSMQPNLELRQAIDTLLPSIFFDQCSFTLGAGTFDDFWGTLGGMNEFGDLEKAQLLDNTTNTIINITHVMAWFDQASVVGNGNLRAKIYATDGVDGDGNAGAPGTLLGQSEDIQVSDIQVNDSLIVTTFFPLATPVTAAESSFFLSVDLTDLYATNDTVGLLHTTNGCGDGMEAYERWNDNDWFSMFDAWSTGSFTLDINFPIFAIVEFDDPSSVQDPYILQNGLRLFPAAPNPARELVRLGYELESTSQVQIEIYSMDGRQLQNRSLGKLPAGEYYEEIAVNDLPAGSYIYGIVTDRSRLMSKFMVE